MPPKKRRTRRAHGGVRRLLHLLILVAASVAVLAATLLVVLYLSYARMVDARLDGDPDRTAPRIFARPLDVWRGQQISQLDLIARLNDLSYAQRPEDPGPGEFSVRRNVVAVTPRAGEFAGRTVRLTLPEPASAHGIRDITVAGSGAMARATLDRPLVTTIASGEVRLKRRHARLSEIPMHVRQAVLAVEDQTFYSHPGVNPFRLAAAVLTNVRGQAGAPVGNSTITQQLARMMFQADAFNAELRTGSRSYVRYVQGALMSVALEQRASKDEILELYLTDVYLGQRGSFAIHGVGEAARLFFGKDVGNLTIGEGALIAGVIQSPASRSPFTNRERALERRNLVIRAMADEGHITPSQADHASREPLRVAPRAVDHEAPYFVDLVAQHMAEQRPEMTAGAGPIDVQTTLDLNLQRVAIEAVERGLLRIDRQIEHDNATDAPQAALLAADPRTGEVLALVGGRSYSGSQFNRAVAARRQPGSVVKPFVFLAAFEHAVATGRTDLTPASLASDAPRVLEVDGALWEPRNFDGRSEPSVTWRQALAQSRNLATIDVGQQIGFDSVAALWRRLGVRSPPRPYPSIALGAFELTPIEVAQAYTLFVNGGRTRPLRLVDRIDRDGQSVATPIQAPIVVARADTTFLVTHMLRSVMNGGTGSSARAAGFIRDAAGKTGTTNDLRDAWFVGFTPELLAVVWVGLDDNRPLGLTGSEAALPIWTEFMTRALAGRTPTTFETPDGVILVDIDAETGLRSTPRCPTVIEESFLNGTEPAATCALHP